MSGFMQAERRARGLDPNDDTMDLVYSSSRKSLISASLCTLPSPRQI